jgi:ABC-type branched-subunit amino acid transport system ATPase component
MVQEKMKSKILLKSEKVDKKFGGIYAVDSLSVSISEGEIVAMIGPNGSGKTTFINLLSGIYRCDAGRVLFKGQDITGIRPHQIILKGIVRTFQNLRIFKNMSILENVLIGAHSLVQYSLIDVYLRPLKKIKSEKKVNENAIRCLSLVNLHDRREDLARNLPYGKQRMLEIARALVSDPLLILLDEPTAGMNPKEVVDLCLFLKKIRNMGHTLFIIEHNMRAVMSISDRIVVLNAGAKLKEGKPEEIKNDPEVQELYLGKEEE